MNSENKKRPLAGVRALELAEIWAGPYCGALLGDMGAEIVKVESIQRISRGAINPRPGSPGYPDGDPGERPWNRSANFNVLNRNKQGITLDLTSARGVEVFKELAAVSDVVFCNSAFGVMEKFGLGYEELRQVK
ncbi:MAG TPA: CoA transferase, partial [Dehalococcoidia bacterium]|nr:CoA transferase [Dehalococcoidia bacterium]